MNLSFFDFASEVNFLFPVRERDFPNGKEKTSLSFRFKKNRKRQSRPRNLTLRHKFAIRNLNEGAEEGEAGSQVLGLGRTGPPSVRCRNG